MIRKTRIHTILALVVGALALSVGVVSSYASHADEIVPFQNVTLEMSLKPFRQTDIEYVRTMAENLFQQWSPLLRQADQVSVLLWTADGSEILDYAGSMDAPIEWARYIGGANSKYAPGGGPESLSLHERPYLYTENPPEITYDTLKTIVNTLREVGKKVTGKPVRVGATFDPGPEFAKSSFKYERHPEVCQGNTMGKGTFVCCYAVLHGDDRAYAAYPEGIPEGTPFGAFFGKQCQYFLTDLGFDYIWLSNGFGFGLETWGVTGAVFDGERFDTARIREVRDKILQFWTLFREGCPDFPIETRGTNLSTGMDLAADGVPLRSIYEGGFGMEPPPNSPWAALDGDFGLELVGYMSKIAELPGDTFPFRFYIHDPWWLNSPWLDRYGREPHDIYLPMSVARLNGEGEVRNPTSLLFLTVDNSFGEMPDQVPNEVIPHILAARADSPDEPGPFVWVYPFDEYHDMTFASQPRVEEVLFGDWFMRQAVNDGLPLNTVISSRNLLQVIESRADALTNSILITRVPDAGSRLESALQKFIHAGGGVLFYGPLENAGSELLDELNVTLGDPVSGELPLKLATNPDRLATGDYPSKVVHRPPTCAGGIRAVLAQPDDPDTDVYATVGTDDKTRVIALARAVGPGRLAWVRGTNSNVYRKGSRLLVSDDPNQVFGGQIIMRHMLHAFGYDFTVNKSAPNRRTPLVCVARHDNGYFFSGYDRDTLVELGLRFPQGAPVLIGAETQLVDGRSTYRMPRAWHKECRVFVDGQREGELSCIEQPSVQYGIARRIRVSGLQNATVRVYPPKGFDAKHVQLLINANYPYKRGRVEPVVGSAALGGPLEVPGVTGTLTIAW